jgi:hypothetical protein
MRDVRALRKKVGDLSERVSTYETRDKAEEDDKHWAEHKRLQEAEKTHKAEREASARETIRKGNVDAILSDVAKGDQDRIDTMLAGLQAKGKIDLYNGAEGAGAALRTKLGKDHPEWFPAASDGAGGGLPGIPGQGLPTGPVIGMDRAELDQLTDEQIKAYVNRPASDSANP